MWLVVVIVLNYTALDALGVPWKAGHTTEKVGVQGSSLLPTPPYHQYYEAALLTLSWPTTILMMQLSGVGWWSCAVILCWIFWNGRLCKRKSVRHAAASRAGKQPLIARPWPLLTDSFSTIAAFPWNCCPSHVRHDASIWNPENIGLGPCLGKNESKPQFPYWWRKELKVASILYTINNLFNYSLSSQSPGSETLRKYKCI